MITEPEYRTLDDDLISKINEFRADPSKLKAILEQNLTYFLDDGFNYKVPGQFEITTLGGIDAVNAAITQIELFIDLAVPAGNLTFEEGLETACKDHVDDTAATEVIGNTGADSSSPADRVDRHGLATGVQQIMSYGRIRAEDAIVKMIFDDDTAQAKLLTLLGTDLMYFGAFSGTHSGKGHQSCVVFAETYVDNVDDSKVTQTI